MKLHHFIAAAAFVASQAFAAPGFVVDFEKTWDFGNGSVDGYYGGGTAADGTSGPNVGVTFSGVSGLSNDALGPYYANAPTPQGVMYVYDVAAVMNVAAGVDNLSFWFSSLVAVPDAIQAWSGLNGTGMLLGSRDLAANNTTFNDTWTQEIFSFGGTAHSFNFGGSALAPAAFDNIASVPEPATCTMVLAGLGLLGLMGRRRKHGPA